jgi:CRP/FNR family transcriptional regulator, anaerobic regulatory protein
MTSGANQRSTVKSLAGLPLAESKTDRLAALHAALSPHLATIRTRRGQNVTLMAEGGEAAFIVRTGVLTVSVTMPGTSRQVVAILFPGDVLCSGFVPCEADATLTPASAGELWRLRWPVFAELSAKDAAVASFYHEAIDRQMACRAIHVAAIGQFDCRQRVATFLLELALRTGTPSPSGGGVVFDMPLSRIDVADYLGLNADTLSRTMSRLRSSGVLIHSERNRVVVRDLRSLAALSPASRALIDLHGDRAL